MQGIVTIGYTAMTDSEILRVWSAMSKAEQDSRKERQRIEGLLESRMRERGATAIPDVEFDVKLDKGTPTLDPSIIMLAHELLPLETVMEAFTPAHQERIDVPDSWDLRKVNTWPKYGDEVRNIVERAKVYAEARLKITRKVTP